MYKNVILFGGDGFLGKGLQRELTKRNVLFKSIDIKDYDLVNFNNLARCIEDLKDITHIVILASKIGAVLFNTYAKISADYNKKLHTFMYEAIIRASRKYNKSYNVTYYSTSEIFGNRKSIDDIITDKSEYTFNINSDRQLYSYIKYEAEQDYIKLNYDCPDIVNSIKIIRPFNVYGQGQRRGVVYEMLMSLKNNNYIEYSEDTTRTMTNIDFASKYSTDVILADNNINVNIADKDYSMSMKTLAEVIKISLNRLDCKLIPKPKDTIVQYRHVSKITNDIDFLVKNMSQHIQKLYLEIS